MSIKFVDPRDVNAWDSLLSQNDHFSVFLTAGWAAVLAETYRYRPGYLTNFEKDTLSLLMPFMEARSFLTVKRGVSLPFTDYCPPFSRQDRSLLEARDRALDYGRVAQWRYIEWRDSAFLGSQPPHTRLTSPITSPFRRARESFF